MCLMMFALPFQGTLFAQDVATACNDAKSQAVTDTPGSWFFAGCLGGVIGYLIAANMESNPSASQLLGKSPEYVAAYTDCYRAETKRLRAKKALNGCLVAAAAYVVYIVVAIAALDNADEL